MNVEVKRHILARAAKELTERYTRALGTNLVALAFFGSWARGEEREDSDLDVLLIAQELPTHPLERNRRIYEPLWEWRAKPCAVSILARTVREFTADITPLHLDLAAARSATPPARRRIRSEEARPDPIRR